MLWIVIGGAIGAGFAAWARAAARKFERGKAERRERAETRRLDRQEEELLARLRAKDEP